MKEAGSPGKSFALCRTIIEDYIEQKQVGQGEYAICRDEWRACVYVAVRKQEHTYYAKDRSS